MHYYSHDYCLFLQRHFFWIPKSCITNQVISCATIFFKSIWNILYSGRPKYLNSKCCKLQFLWPQDILKKILICFAKYWFSIFEEHRSSMIHLQYSKWTHFSLYQHISMFQCSWHNNKTVKQLLWVYSCFTLHFICSTHRSQWRKFV